MPKWRLYRKDFRMNKLTIFFKIQLFSAFLVSTVQAMVPVKNQEGLHSSLMMQWRLPQQAGHSQNFIFGKKVEEYMEKAEKIINSQPAHDMKTSIQFMLDRAKEIDLEIKPKINHTKPEEREHAFNKLKYMLEKTLGTYHESLDKNTNNAFQHARTLVLVKIASTLVDMARGTLIRAIGSQDKTVTWFGLRTTTEDIGIEHHLAYWKEQERNIGWYKWHRHPFKIFNKQDAEDEVEDHIKALKKAQDSYYNALGVISKEVDKFKVEASIAEQNGWVASLLSTINTEILTKKSDLDSQQLSYNKLRASMAELVSDLQRYNKNGITALLAKHKKPHFIERHWLLSTAGAVGAAAIGCYLFSQKDKFPTWYKKVQASFNTYLLQPLKDVKDVIFGDDLEKERDDVRVKLNKEMDTLKNLLRDQKTPEELLAEKTRLQEHYEDEVKCLYGKRAEDNQGQDILEERNGRMRPRIIPDEAKRIELERAINASLPADKQIVLNDQYVQERAEEFVNPEAGRSSIAMNILKASLSCQGSAINRVGAKAKMPDDYVKKYLTYMLGLREVDFIIKYVDEDIKKEGIPSIARFVSTLGLFIQGYMLQGGKISDTTNNIIEILNKEADAVLAQGKKILRANRFTFTASALLPSIAAAGIIGWGGKKMWDWKSRINYWPIRNAIVEIGQLLNRYEDINSTNDKFGDEDYGKLIYLLDRLRHYNSTLVPSINKERFGIDIDNLESPITAQQKMRVIDLMYRRYDFLNIGYKG